MNAPVNLETCAQEPIHIPGSIQPHGVLLACRGADLAIVQVSENLEAFFGIPARDALDRPLSALLAGESVATIAHGFAEPAKLQELNPLLVRSLDGTAFDAVLHVAAGGQFVIELERADTSATVGFGPRLRASLLRLQRGGTLEGLSQIAAEEVRDITGFDRVMVYRFDPEWNGEVVAESRRDDLEPFLGLHYPASDIPAQARRLYAINLLRLIGDVSYTPVVVVPTDDPATGQPLDMSFGMLRSVSPIHIEYLRNMGVTSSMSVSLVIDGVLTGLIACHHYSGPRVVSFRTRDTVEYLARSIAWNINVLEIAARSERARASALRETSLVRAIQAGNGFLEGIASTELVALTEAAGVAVVLTEGTRQIGSCPPVETIELLVQWLASAGHDVFSTDNANAALPFMLPEEAAGILAVAISPALREYLVWFRPSSTRTVDWAGDPKKSVQVVAGAPRLSPRGSFALWRETVKDRSEPWDDITIDAASNLRKTLLSGVRIRAMETAAYNQRLLDADRAKDDFIATVSHELRTPLNAVLGWAQLMSDSAPTPARLQQGLDVILRNGRAQAQIVDDLLDVSRMVSGKLALDLATVDLHSLVQDVIDSLEVGITAKGLRLRRVLDPAASPVLGDTTRVRQIVANLLNNAMKFTPKGGSINVSLRRLDSEVELVVADSGQGIKPDFLPLVFDVFRQGDSGMNRRSQGLGLGLAISRKLAELHGGRITAQSDGEGKGATFAVRLPIASVRLQEPTPPGGVAAGSQPLVGYDILVVEDERDSRELLVNILVEAGARCTGAADAEEAIAKLKEAAFTLIISDIGLPGFDGLELMRSVRASAEAHGSRIPAIALTAYTRPADRTAVLKAGFDAHLGKPVDASELLAVVQSVVSRSRR